MTSISSGVSNLPSLNSDRDASGAAQFSLSEEDNDNAGEPNPMQGESSQSKFLYSPYFSISSAPLTFQDRFKGYSYLKRQRHEQRNQNFDEGDHAENQSKSQPNTHEQSNSSPMILKFSGTFVVIQIDTLQIYLEQGNPQVALLDTMIGKETSISMNHQSGANLIKGWSISFFALGQNSDDCDYVVLSNQEQNQGMAFANLSAGAQSQGMSVCIVPLQNPNQASADAIDSMPVVNQEAEYEHNFAHDITHDMAQDYDPDSDAMMKNSSHTYNEEDFGAPVSLDSLFAEFSTHQRVMFFYNSVLCIFDE